MGEQMYRPEKMRAAILFFVSRIKNGTLGRTKLAKLLYYADFDHFEKYGQSVTGAEYIHKARGPYPKQLVSELRQIPVLQESATMAGPYPQYLYTVAPEWEIDLSLFSQTELLMLVDVANKWERQTATEITAASHGEAPWIATAQNEVIPYVYAYYRNNFEISPDTDEDDVGHQLVANV